MRFLTIAFFTLLFSGIAVAQTSIGVRGGFGQSSVRSGEAFDLVTDQLSGISTFSAGVFAELPLSESISFRPGLEYTQRGAKVGLGQDLTVAGIALPLGARATTTFGYVDAPLLLQYNVPTQGAIQPYAFAGPSLGYATGGKLRTSAKAIIEFQLSDTDIDLDAINYQRFHVAAVGGVGVKAVMSEGVSAFAEARYEHGLSQPYDVPLATDKVGFNGWNLGVGVAYTLR